MSDGRTFVSPGMMFCLFVSAIFSKNSVPKAGPFSFLRKASRLRREKNIFPAIPRPAPLFAFPRFESCKTLIRKTLPRPSFCFSLSFSSQHVSHPIDFPVCFVCARPLLGARFCLWETFPPCFSAANVFHRTSGSFLLWKQSLGKSIFPACPARPVACSRIAGRVFQQRCLGHFFIHPSLSKV